MSANQKLMINEASADQKNRNFIIAIILTSVICVVEIAGGFWTGSLALLSDAAHVFMDIFALGLSYFAIRASLMPPDDRHTYGYHRMQVLAALANGALLLLISFEILQAAISRFRQPQPIIAGPMLAIAVTGLVVNLGVAFVLREHNHNDLNVRSAFFHVLGDALASIGVIGGGIAILLTHQPWIDPMVSILISLLILFTSGRLLRETVHILAEGSPEGMTASGVAEMMKAVNGVSDIHDLHIWTVSPGYLALSAHVILDDQTLSQSNRIMEELKQILSSRFKIDHTTIQFECADCGQGLDTEGWLY
jgi:cobalt-zinc-cadmium efflux system protein